MGGGLGIAKPVMGGEAFKAQLGYGQKQLTLQLLLIQPQTVCPFFGK